NRFKYGFFADDFTTEVYSDVANPQYSASFESEGDLSWGSSMNPLENDLSKSDKSVSTIMQPTKLIQKETSLVVPPKYTWSMKHFTENMFFVDVPVLDQFNATEKIHPCVKVTDSTTVGEAYYIAVNRRQSQFYTEGLPGIVTLYFQAFGQGAAIT